MRFAFLILAGVLAACSPAAPSATEAPAAPEAAAPQSSDAVTTLVVEAPLANAQVTSPLVATGVAPSNWYFEAVLPARIESADGTLIAEAPAQAQSDWMVEGPVRFKAELTFSVTAETPAVLVLQEDMPREGEPVREVRVPVVLTP